MKTRKDRFIIQALLFATLSLLINACSSDVTYEEALDKNRQNIEDPKTVQDANFLVEAKSLNLLGSQLATVAADSAYSSALSDFATLHAEQNETMADDLKELAREKDIKLPTQMSEEHKALYYQLSSAGRNNFDRIFIRLANQVNQENQLLFTRNATEANDPDIRAFAARKLDQLKANMAEVRKVEEQLLETLEQTDQP